MKPDTFQFSRLRAAPWSLSLLLMIWQLGSLPALPQAAGGGGEVAITAEITDTGDRPAGEFTLEGPNEGAFGADTTVFTVVWDRPDGVSVEDAPNIGVAVEIVAAQPSTLDSPINQPVVEYLNWVVREKEIPWQLSTHTQGGEVFSSGAVIVMFPVSPRILPVAESRLLPLVSDRSSA